MAALALPLAFLAAAAFLSAKTAACSVSSSLPSLLMSYFLSTEAEGGFSVLGSSAEAIEAEHKRRVRMPSSAGVLCFFMFEQGFANADPLMTPLFPQRGLRARPSYRSGCLIDAAVCALRQPGTHDFNHDGG